MKNLSASRPTKSALFKLLLDPFGHSSKRFSESLALAASLHGPLDSADEADLHTFPRFPRPLPHPTLSDWSLVRAVRRDDSAVAPSGPRLLPLKGCAGDGFVSGIWAGKMGRDSAAGIRGHAFGRFSCYGAGSRAPTCRARVYVGGVRWRRMRERARELLCVPVCARTLGGNCALERSCVPACLRVFASVLRVHLI